MNRNLQYTLKYDPCNHMFSFGIETVQRQMSLYDYQPGNCTLIYIKVTKETKIAFLINKCMVVCSYQNTRSEIITKTRSTHVLTLSGSTMKMSIYSALRTE